MSNLYNLEKLELNISYHITNLLPLIKLSKLQELKLCELDIINLEFIENIQTLKELNIDKCEIIQTDLDNYIYYITNLSSFKHFESLKILTLKESDIYIKQENLTKIKQYRDIS